jgi:hypothetical protein
MGGGFEPWLGLDRLLNQNDDNYMYITLKLITTKVVFRIGRNIVKLDGMIKQ